MQDQPRSHYSFILISFSRFLRVAHLFKTILLADYAPSLSHIDELPMNIAMHFHLSDDNDFRVAWNKLQLYVQS